MLYFIDENGLFQLTGVGLVIFLPLALMVLIGLYRTLKDLVYMIKDYKRLKQEEAEFDGEALNAKLEEYYQKRKAWEKKKGYW